MRRPGWASAGFARLELGPPVKGRCTTKRPRAGDPGRSGSVIAGAGFNRPEAGSMGVDGAEAASAGLHNRRENAPQDVPANNPGPPNPYNLLILLIFAAMYQIGG